MNKEEYKQLRETIGTREEYAELTGNTVRTIQRREEGTFRIRVEAEIVVRLFASKCNVIKEAYDLIGFALPVIEDEEDVYKKGVKADIVKRMRLFLENVDVKGGER